MKKLFLALLAAATVTSASAQPGSILLYGNLNYSSTSIGSLSANSWGIAPGIGYQLNKNWTVGINVSYSATDSSSWGGGPKSSTFGVGPFARYSHAMGSMFYCFGQADVSYMSYSDGGSTTGSSVGINLWPAVGMNLGKAYALNFSLGGLGYSSYSPKGGGTSVGTLNFNFGQTMMIGLSKNFGCGMKHKGHHEDSENMNKMDNDDDAPKKGKKAKKDKDDE